MTSFWPDNNIWRVKNKYPVPETSKEQEQLLKTVTDVNAISWNDIMDIELEELKYQCSQTDIDYEFIIDSSGSIGELIIYILWLIIYDS